MDGTMHGGAGWVLDARAGGEMAGRWWKWALSAPEERSPVRDETGEHAGWRQPADVWFLAGTYGGRVERRCTIPAGRPLFFPVLNTQHTREYAPTPQSMRIAQASAHLNGVALPLEDYVGTFRYPLLTSRFATGRWGTVAPLSPGSYVLEIRGRSTSGFCVDTTYHLEAVAR
ncbi:hypothetical protein [Streptomyces sp. NPDC060194]|uniref:hypothetical protein n=1 Tax=Streptomyces sp. NPDC060194 TaxID=3347069 RepID=UPI0036651BF2